MYFTQQSQEKIHYFFWMGYVNFQKILGGNNNMGIFDSFFKGFNEGRERARREAYRRRDFPVKLVEPSTGRIVELQVIEPDDAVAKMYMRQLEAYAKALEQYGVQRNINGKRIRLTFTDGNMAENARKTWKK